MSSPISPISRWQAWTTRSADGKVTREKDHGAGDDKACAFSIIEPEDLEGFKADCESPVKELTVGERIVYSCVMKPKSKRKLRVPRKGCTDRGECFAAIGRRG